MRRIAVTIATAALMALALALPAHADPPGLFLDTGNGARTVRVHHPDHPDWYITVSLDNVFGFVPGGDAGPEYASAYASIADGPGALRFQVNNPRLRIDQAASTRYVNDYFPSPVANPRTNTPGADALSCAVNATVTRPPGYVTLTGTPASLYDERAPKDGECEGASQLVPNFLNNASDYSPDATIIRARGDWIVVSGSGQTAVRVFFLVRWNNGDLTAHSVGSNFAAYGT